MWGPRLQVKTGGGKNKIPCFHGGRYKGGGIYLRQTTYSLIRKTLKLMPDAQGRIGAPITVEEANQYIDAHISQFFDTGKYPIKSFIFDAGLLRDYLVANPEIQNMKFMLGMRPDGTGNNTSTMIIVGYDANGNYIKTADQMVLDQAGACPYNCPSVGNAAHDHIIW